jgi:hypothetical protein
VGTTPLPRQAWGQESERRVGRHREKRKEEREFIPNIDTCDSYIRGYNFSHSTAMQLPYSLLFGFLNLLYEYFRKDGCSHY